MRHAGRDQSLPGKFDGAEFVRKTIMEQEKNRNIFETMPVPQAVRIMARPTIISQLFILNHFLGMYGIVWSQVTADILTVTLSAYVYFSYRKRLVAGD